jgi:murein DD-endopeptidase MepM/ murein hydrolase activator NlpD
VLLLVLGVVCVVVASSSLDPGGAAQAASGQQLQRLQRDIRGTERRVDQRRGRERVLTSDVRRYSARITVLRDRVSGLEARQRAAQSDLDRSSAALVGTQGELRTQRRRLVRLRSRLAGARRVLAARLVELYQADKPDLVGVVVNSRGFSDLLERAEFMARIGRQDQRVVTAVRRARTKAVSLERRLAVLERAQRRTAERIEARRNEIVQVKSRAVAARDSVAAARASRTSLLTRVRTQRRTLEGSLASMRREEAGVRRKIAAAAASQSMPAAASGSASARTRGSGALVWPAEGQFTSPFGQRWGRLHAGIDIAVPTGTAVRAADAGTITIAGWTGGYGNYVCIDVGSGLTACGAHNSQLKVRVGQRVARGEVIALSGNTGNSTGPHVHFETRVGGVPRDPMGYL